MSASAKPVVALPETRQLDVLAGLLERRNFDVLRCPLVAILDAPDRQIVLDWIDRLIDEPPALLILYTGEGVRRLAAAAEAAGRLDRFKEALAKTRMLTRGAKPVRALKLLGLRAALAAAEPTTAGVIETLRGVALDGRRVAVQLYGQDGIPALEQFLLERNCDVDAVAPYIYAPAADDLKVVDLIGRIRAGEVDAIAFTSKAQVSRLMQVAAKHGSKDGLRASFGDCKVAAVGPVVARELERHGIRVDLVPETGYFMKPLVTCITRALA